MTLEQHQVREWMKAFGQETPEKPTLPSLEIRKLRALLILEEAVECVNALGFSVNYDWSEITEEENWANLVAIADALADLHYVGYCGTGSACGLNMDDIFSEVDACNWSKFWTEEEIETHYHNQSDLNLTKIDEDCFLVKNTTGKVIKSPSTREPDLKRLIDNQQSLFVIL